MSRLIAALVVTAGVWLPQPPAQAPASTVTAAQLTAAIDTLGSFDFPIRSAASRTVRRAEAGLAVPALVKAVRDHADSYVRYRALVLLAGFGDAATAEVMAEVIADKNDRLRAVAYQWFERHPDPAIVPRLLEALPKEQSEFVRPELMRAIAAYGGDARARQAILPLVTSGLDSFRGEAIQALGDHQATYARDAILGVATLDGPLQEDAILALGKLGDPSIVPALADLQQSAPKDRQPALAAAGCLAGEDCASHRAYLIASLKFGETNAGFQPLLRGAAHALSAIAASGKGDRDALNALLDAGVAASEPSRSSIALGIGRVALYQPTFLLDVLEARPDVDAACALVRDAFDMFEEDFEEELFYVAIRRAYWAAPAESARRKAAERLIQVLEF